MPINKMTTKAKMDERLRTSNSYLFAPVLAGTATTPIPDFAAEMAIPSVGRYWRTLIHLRPSQLFYLIRNRMLGRNDLNRWSKEEVSLRGLEMPRTISEWEPDIARQIIRLGGVQFTAVGPAESNGTSWWESEITRRQLYYANYCDFLNVDLTAPEDGQLLHGATRIALSWCQQNPTGTEMGWHPFFLSLRIVNWLKYLVRNAARAKELGDGAGIDEILASLRVQVLSLESRLERELLANHLLKNAKALVFAGALIGAPETGRWRALGEKLLRQQIAEQVLADGGHIERSPMYHAWVLDHLLDVKHLFESYPPDAPECAVEVCRCVEKMATYLAHIIHPDGEIPLLNDSQLGVTRPASQILSEAGASKATIFEEGSEVEIFDATGYAVIRDLSSRSFLIFDCGPLGPDYQPGHGHCDVLSYELTLNGKRVIVDTGVSSYERSPERHYERSTAAHNTIRIDDVEQAEIWAGFRVGRRPSVSLIRQGRGTNLQFVQGSHFGYKHLGIVHSRTIVHLNTNSWVFVDCIGGTGSHKVESFIHFHPAIDIQPIVGPPMLSTDIMIPRWSLEFDGVRYLLMTLGAGTTVQTKAWYSPGFAIRLPQPMIHWVWEGKLPATMLYAVVPEGSPSISVCQLADKGGIEIDNTFIPLDGI